VWTLREVPDAAEADRLLTAAWDREPSPAVAIKEMKRVRGKLWLHVEVLSGSACERVLSDVTPAILGEGWIEAHDASGRLTVWFETYCD
jgi:hypothetical protein